MPNTLGDADIQPMLDAFGVPVVVGAASGNGIKNERDGEVLKGDGSSLGVRIVSVRVKTATFLAVTSLGAAITVDGEALKVINFARLDDGKTMTIDCAKVAS